MNHTDDKTEADFQKERLAEAEAHGKELGAVLWEIYRIDPATILRQLREDPELVVRLRTGTPTDAEGIPLSRKERDLRSLLRRFHAGEKLMMNHEPEIHNGVTIDFMRDSPSALYVKITASNHTRAAEVAGWLPIEGAPLDGTKVQLLVFNHAHPGTSSIYEQAVYADGDGFTGWLAGPKFIVRLRKDDFLIDVTHYKPIQPAN